MVAKKGAFLLPRRECQVPVNSATIRFTAIILAFYIPASAYALMYRPQREYRTINTSEYEIVLQKNGRLTVKTTSGEVLIANAYPMLWLADDAAPRQIKTDGRWSFREEVNDPLGQGHGFVLERKDCEWHIRTYTTKPYITVQLAFINMSKKPVRIESLMPLCVGGDGVIAGTLDPSRTVIAANGVPITQLDAAPGLSRGEISTLWNFAAFNRESRHSLIAGFLTNLRGIGHLEMRDPLPTDGYATFISECRYDPPLTVAPGARIFSEVLFLGLNERSPLEGLQRFGHAMAAFNAGPAGIPFPIHGLYLDPNGEGDRTEPLINQIREFSAALAPYSYRHVTIGSGWQVNAGDWLADPVKFPRGLKPLVDAVHAAGMTAGLSISPFTVAPDSQLARDHPDWLAPLRGSAAGLFPAGTRVLDPSVEAAMTHLTELIERVTGQWGFDAVIDEGPLHPLLLAESLADTNKTTLEILQTAMASIRQTIGSNRFLSAPPPIPITSVMANGVNLATNTPSDVQAVVAQLGQRFYLSPYPAVPVAAPPANVGSDSLLAAYTAMALAGVVTTAAPARDAAILQRLLPTPELPARPIDLFDHDPPQIWHLPVASPAGDYQVLAVFNPNGDAAAIEVPFVWLGQAPDTYFSVYSFWESKYYGTARRSLTVEVPPGGVRVLGLKPYVEHPTLLAIDSHIAQGGASIRAVRWDAATRSLHGSLELNPAQTHPVKILAPEVFRPVSVAVDSKPSPFTVDGRVASFDVHPGPDGRSAFVVQY